MKYINAADVLPQELLVELSKYAGGNLLYVPTLNEKSSWGEKSGSRQFFRERNQKIKELFHQGMSLEALSGEYGLALDTIKRIVR